MYPFDRIFLLKLLVLVGINKVCLAFSFLIDCSGEVWVNHVHDGLV